MVPGRVGVVRGRVLAEDGRALPSVTVTVVDHPELGQTLTRSDGKYDLAVNSGDPLTLHFERAGFLPADRDADPAMRDYEPLDDVVLKPYDTAVTEVAPDTATEPLAARSF